MAIDHDDGEIEALLIGLNDCGTAGQREWQALAAEASTMDALLSGRRPKVPGLGGLRPSLAKEIRSESLSGRGRRVMAEASALGIGWVTCRQPGFPAGLSALANPPLVLFYRGTLPAAQSRRLAIVGARRASRHGRIQAERIARSLAERGVEIVSGLARGVDRSAHEGALAGKAATHGILGCGLARVYPAEHEALAEAMCETGSVIAEFSPAMPPLPGNFPRRNRLIAALSDSLLLIEAGEKSGGLITVRWANDLGRDVLVLPGQVDNPSAAGCLALLRDGARLVRNADDILEDLGWLERAEGKLTETAPGPAELRLEAGERRVLALLDHEAVELEVLLGALELGPGELLTRLMALELKGLARQEPGLRFRRA